MEQFKVSVTILKIKPGAVNPFGALTGDFIHIHVEVIWCTFVKLSQSSDFTSDFKKEIDIFGRGEEGLVVSHWL